MLNIFLSYSRITALVLVAIISDFKSVYTNSYNTNSKEEKLIQPNSKTIKDNNSIAKSKIKKDKKNKVQTITTNISNKLSLYNKKKLGISKYNVTDDYMDHIKDSLIWLNIIHPKSINKLKKYGMIFDADSIKDLDLSYNKFLSEKYISHILGFQNIKSLKLRGSLNNFMSLSVFKKLKNLEYIDLSSNKLDKSMIIDLILYSPNLKTLVIKNIGITINDYLEILKANKLSLVSGNQTYNKSNKPKVNIISELNKKVKKLLNDKKSNKMLPIEKDYDTNTLSKLQSVFDKYKLFYKKNLINVKKKLNLRDIKINDEDLLVIIRNMTKLEELSLSYTGINSESIKDIKYLKNLKRLYVSGNNISDEGVINISENLPFLEKLVIEDNKVLTSFGMSKIYKLKNLQFLSLYNSHLVSNESIINISKINKLSILDIRKTKVNTKGTITLNAFRRRKVTIR